MSSSVSVGGGDIPPSPAGYSYVEVTIPPRSVRTYEKVTASAIVWLGASFLFIGKTAVQRELTSCRNNTQDTVRITHKTPPTDDSELIFSEARKTRKTEVVTLERARRDTRRLRPALPIVAEKFGAEIRPRVSCLKVVPLNLLTP